MELIVSLSDIDNLEKLSETGIKNIIITSKEFGDRANRFFTLDELDEVIEKAEVFNVKVYLNMNVMVHEFELDNMKDYLERISKMNFEGIYFNDLSVLSLAEEYNIKDKLIFNPDTLMSNTSDIKSYLDYGIKSVMISKEITVYEVKDIIKAIPNRLQMIIHGRLCMSYSRRMFVKNYLDHIGSDYDYKKSDDLTLIESTREHKMPIMENEHGTSIFTDFTFCSLNDISQLDKLDKAIIDDVFMDFDEVLDAVKMYQQVLNSDSEENHLDKLREKYPESNYDSGYLHRKTNLVK